MTETKEQWITHSTDEWEYYLNSTNQATLTKYLKRAPVRIEIPDEIDGYPVAYLGARLLKNRKTLKNITLPKGLRSIDKEAFYGCESLAICSTDLPDTLIQIGDRAFQGCTLVGDAFDEGGCMFTFPLSCKFIGTHAFYGTNGHYRLVLPPTIMSLGGGAFSHSGVKYVRCVCCVSKECFSDCKQLKKAIIDNIVDSYAFYRCNKLEDVEFKEGATAIGYSSFEKIAIENIAFPKTLKTIHDAAFLRCKALRQVSFASVVSMRGAYIGAFRDDPVEEVTLPEEIQDAIYNGKKLNKKQTTFIKALVSSGLKSYSVLMALAATV